MTEQIERHTYLASEVAEVLLDDGMPDCDKIDLIVEGKILVIQITGARRPEGRPAPAVTTERKTPKRPEPEKRPKGGRLCQRAAILCNEGAFHKFLSVADSDKAKLSLHSMCGINSRAELDHNPSAAKEFIELANEYEAWMKDPS